MNTMSFLKLKYLLTVIFSVFFILHHYAQSSRELAYEEGEYLKFRIHYGVLNAGVATLKLSSSKRNGKTLFHAVGKGWTTGAPKMFFKVNDTYESYFTKEKVAPVFFKRRVDEGGYIIRRDLYFDNVNHTVTVDDLQKNTKTVYTVNDIQDMLSSFYYLRTIDINNLQKGDFIALNIFFDGESFPFRLKFIDKEIIRTSYGNIMTWKVQPMVQKGRVFEDEESLTIWVTDDSYKIPVRIKAKLVVGSLKADLDGFYGIPGFKNSFKE